LFVELLEDNLVTIIQVVFHFGNKQNPNKECHDL